MERNAVLILGRPAPIVRDFIAELLKRTSNPVADADVEKLREGPVTLPWRIENKYYSADLRIWGDVTNGEEEEVEDVESGGGGGLEWDALKEAVDAFVFVYDKGQPESFKDVKPWAAFVASAEPGVVLCVAGGKKDGSTEEQLDAASEWCVEHGFEFVDLDEEEEEYGSVGMGRVIEALSSNMWPGMVKKTGTKEVKGDVGQTSDAGDVKGSGAAKEDDDDIPEEFLIRDGDPFAEKIRAFRGSIGTGDEELDFDDLVTRLGDLRALAQTVGGEERRKMAAQVALSLFNSD
ncbi:hypothetical protein HK101_011302 [Irineochytrium annulatum]|nr:hypothetical protein HK101_011302 [Irineochytrium annulatum]